MLGVAVALHGDGAMVTIPAPARYAVHKLIIAQERSVGTLKRRKGLDQAKLLMDCFVGTEHAVDLDRVMQEARSRGPKWRANIEASLAIIAAFSPEP